MFAFICGCVDLITHAYALVFGDRGVLCPSVQSSLGVGVKAKRTRKKKEGIKWTTKWERRKRTKRMRCQKRKRRTREEIRKRERRIDCERPKNEDEEDEEKEEVKE